MAEPVYELIFSGDLAPDIPEAEIQANVAKLFKASPAQIAHLFSGKRVVLKNNLALATGKKYLAALKQAGALCQLVDMQSGAIYGEPAAQAAPVATTAPEPQPKEPAPVAAATAETSATSEAAKQTGTTEPGAEHRVGGRPDLDAPDWAVAPSGSRMQEETEEVPLPEPDTDYLSLAPQKGNIVEPDNTPPPPAPDTSHISLVNDNKDNSNQ